MKMLRMDFFQFCLEQTNGNSWSCSDVQENKKSTDHDIFSGFLKFFFERYVSNDRS